MKTGKEQKELIYRMRLYNRMKFETFYKLYTFFNHFAQKCYEKYWKVLNDADRKSS
jgi:hypothetical protein